MWWTINMAFSTKLSSYKANLLFYYSDEEWLINHVRCSRPG